MAASALRRSSEDRVRRLLSLALLGLFATSLRAETLSSLLTHTRVLAFDAASSTRQRFTDTQLTELLNIGQRQMIGETRCLQASYNFTLALGTTYYAMPSDFLTVRRLTIGSKNLQEMSPAALDGRSRGWETASGYPTYYFINFSSPTSIGFAPFPAASTDTDTIKVDYFQKAADLSASSDVPFNGVTRLYEFHHGLAYYAAGVAMLTYGRADLAKAYMDVYTLVTQQLGKRCRENPNYLPGASGTQ
jgi:hypothetical protein